MAGEIGINFQDEENFDDGDYKIPEVQEVTTYCAVSEKFTMMVRKVTFIIMGKKCHWVCL